jgi:LmbE family N-acetylglucosaminyl deacetylase
MVFNDNKTPVFFLSPHLDDAVFSAGSIMASLNTRGFNITVINIFTTPNKTAKNTISSTAYLRQCKYKNAEQLFADRIREDKETLSTLKNVKIVNLNLTDALWRTKGKLNIFEKIISKIIPEFNRIYPTYRWHISKGKISKLDDLLVNSLSKRLNGLIPSDSVVFFPCGVGGHVDHVITNKVCKNLCAKKIMWLDFPYNLNCETQNVNPEIVNLEKYEFAEQLQTKSTLISGYKSQLEPIFGKAGPITKSDILYEVKTI